MSVLGGFSGKHEDVVTQRYMERIALQGLFLCELWQETALLDGSKLGLNRMPIGIQ